MKKAIILILFLAVLGGGGYYAYLTFMAPDAPTETNSSDESSLGDSGIIEDTTVLEDEGNSDEMEVTTDEEIFADETADGTGSTPPLGKRRVPLLSKKELFDQNPFVRFSYPSSLEIRTENINSLEVWKGEERIGLISIYTNEDSQTLEQFVQRENIVDYFTDAAQYNISPKPVEVPTTKRTVLFKDFPGFAVSDIYLMEYANLVLVVQDWSDNDIIGQYLVSSMEKIS